jgi:hypothetical protein
LPAEQSQQKRHNRRELNFDEILKIFSTMMLVLASSALAGAPRFSVAPAAASESSASALVDEMQTVWISEFEAEAALPGEGSRAEGETDSTTDMIRALEMYPEWMTNFQTKIAIEQAMYADEQQVVIFALLGVAPSSDDYQYWKGYEDATQMTIDAMNTWPNTGGAVPGTSVEYQLPSEGGPAQSTERPRLNENQSPHRRQN